MERYFLNPLGQWAKPAVLVGLALVLTGCVISDIRNTTREERTRFEDQNRVVDEGRDARDRLFDSQGVMRNPAPFLVAREIPTHHRALPARFSETIQYRSSSPQAPREILESISAMTGVAFEIRDIEGSADDMEGRNGQPGQQQAVPQPTLPMLPMAGGGFPMGFALPQAQQPLTRESVERRLLFRFDGRLSDLLDDIAGQLDASWRYDDIRDRVVFFRFEARILGLNVPAERRTVNSNIGIQGDITGGVNISSESTIDPWSSIMMGVEAILSRNQAFDQDSNGGAGQPGGGFGGGGMQNGRDIIQSRLGSVAANRDLSQLFVLARPDVVQEIADYVEQVNRRFGRNVLIDVRLVEIQTGNDAEFSMNFSGSLMQALSGNRNISLGFLSPEVGASSGFRISGSTGTRLDMDAFLGMLSGVSRATLANQAQIIAINGQPAPFQQVTSIPFVRSVDSVLSEGGLAQTTAQTEEVNVGFTANFIPMVMTNNRVMLQYQIQSSSVLGFEEFGDGTIRVPRVFRQNLQQQAFLNNGDIIVLFGYEQQRSNMNRQRTFFSQRNAVQNERVMTALVIQVLVEGS